MPRPTLPPWYSQEAYDANCEHWAKVRASLVHSQPREFRVDHGDVIAARIFNARKWVEAAQRELAAAEAFARHQDTT